MKRIINTSAGPRGLNNGGVHVKLPVGGVCEISDEDFKILAKSRGVQNMIDARLVQVTDGTPLNQEVALKKGTTSKEMPSQYKQREEDAKIGKSKPVKPEVESIKVEAKRETVKGKQVKKQEPK